jgi:hypothetical protein
MLAAVLLLGGCAASVEERIARDEAAVRGESAAGSESVAEQFVPSEPVVRVEKCDTPPKVVRRKSPMYSWDMMQNKVEGVVNARLFVGSDGEVKHVQVLRDIGYDSAERTRQTLMEYEFTPAKKDGEAVGTWITMTVNWHLPVR